jgi:hypothetical protein
MLGEPSQPSLSPSLIPLAPLTNEKQKKNSIQNPMLIVLIDRNVYEPSSFKTHLI